MKTVDEAFDEWLDGIMMWNPVETRRESALKANIRIADLEWAFYSGYVLGQQSMMETK